MGGILSVRSEVEKGSEFFFTIKLPVYEKQFDEILENNNEVRIHSYLAGKIFCWQKIMILMPRLP